MPAEISTAQPLSAEPMARAQFSNSFGARIGTKPFCIALAAAQPTDKIRWAYLFWTRKAICMARPLWGQRRLWHDLQTHSQWRGNNPARLRGSRGWMLPGWRPSQGFKGSLLRSHLCRRHWLLHTRRRCLQARAVDKNSFLLCKRFRPANQFDSRRSSLDGLTVETSPLHSESARNRVEEANRRRTLALWPDRVN